MPYRLCLPVSLFLAVSYLSADPARAVAVCPEGTVAAPVSVYGTLRPALAEDVNAGSNVVEVNLTASEEMISLHPAPPTPVWTYNGVLPGPMIEANVGDTLIVNFCNDLPEETTIHWHGVETPADMDGSNIAQLTVPPGGTFRYEFPLLHAGTFWYHPHVRTNQQVEKGLYGALIVHDPAQDEALGLPTNEHVLMLDDILLDNDANVVEAFSGDREDVALAILNGREGNIPLVNGHSSRLLNLRRDVPHRIRFINVANARFMRMSIPEHTFWRIGGDQGLLEEPIEIPPAVPVPNDEGRNDLPIQIPPDPNAPTRTSTDRHQSDPDPTTGVLMSPGERADVIFVPTGDGPLTLEWHDTQRGRHSVEFLDGGIVKLAHDVPDGSRPPIYFAQISLFGPTLEGEPYAPPESLVTIDPIDTTNATPLPLAMGHTVPDWDTGEVILFVQGPGKPFMALTPDDVHTVQVNGTYIWEVKNLTEGIHNYHTHGWSFQHIETEWVDLDDPDNPERNFILPAERLENKDTIRLPPRQGTVPGRSFTITRLAVKFSDEGRKGKVVAAGKSPTETESGGWLAHCHILEHSSKGMMTFFQVVNLFDDDFESGGLDAWSEVGVE